MTEGALETPPFQFAAWLLALLATFASPAQAATPITDTVTIDASHPVNTIIPRQALGATLDGMVRGEVGRALTPFNIGRMREAGLARVTYRLRTELGIEVWHWSDAGAWSDAAHSQGYWTSSGDASPGPITWGYKLPRRGDSVDQGNDNGYSRLDDGDPATFWKSNPYLDRRFTGAAESRPQWIVISFGKAEAIDAAQILWATPFASHFRVQYWTGSDPYDDDGRWTTFPLGDRTIAGDPDSAPFRLAAAPVRAKYLRMLLLASSETGPPGSTDIRDRLGYAVRELGLGRLRADGSFEDLVQHAADRDDQTQMLVSSTDPWHRAIDRDTDTEQPSLDWFFASGLAGAPPMIPVGVLYDTPNNAAAEVRYLQRKGWPVGEIELGEEPDGQFVSPEDFADLYLETARAVRAAAPGLMLGGPSMQEAITDTWPDPGPDPEAGRSWSGRFVARLKARGGLAQLGFFSFEHYAFDDVCGPLGEKLREETTLMDKAMADAAAEGVPKTIPWMISEYGFSPFSGRAMSEMPSALLAADIVGQFLSLGGSAAFMFGYPPSAPYNQAFPCAGYGNMMLFEADVAGQADAPMPVFYAEQMMTKDWAAPAGAPHRLYAAHGHAKDARGRPMVTAYPLRDEAGTWSLMLANRDERRAHRVRLTFTGGAPWPGASGPLTVVQYSPADYAWSDLGPASRPTRDEPPRRFALAAGAPIDLPAFSLTVVRPAAAAH